MTEPGAFPDAEEVMMAVTDEFGYSCTVLPQDADGVFDESRMPVVWVARLGGSSDDITDRPILQVGVIASTRSESWRVSGQIRDKVLASAGTAPDGALIDSAREVTGIAQAADIDPQNRLVQAQYQLSFRRAR